MLSKRIFNQILILCLILFKGGVSAEGKANEGLEYLLKAKVLHTISLFITWPSAEASENFSICILGENPDIQNALRLIYQRTPTFREKRVVLRSTNLVDVEGCHIVFISRLPELQLKNTIDQLRDRPLLIYSDNEGYGEHGVHVNLYVDNNKIRFEVNLDASKKAGIGISSQLLRLAKIVKTKE